MNLNSFVFPAGVNDSTSNKFFFLFDIVNERRRALIFFLSSPKENVEKVFFFSLIVEYKVYDL